MTYYFEDCISIEYPEKEANLTRCKMLIPMEDNCREGT